MSKDDIPTTGSAREPDGEWIPQWPQKLRWVGLLSALLMVFFAVLTPVALAKGIADGSPVTAVGLVGVGVTCAAAAVGMFGDAGFRYLGLSKQVTDHEDPRFGRGVRIGQRRFTFIVIVIALAGVTLYATLAAFAWTGGYGGQLLPEGRNDRSGVLFIVVIAVVLATALVLILVVRNDSFVTLDERGIHRTVRRRRLLRVDTVDSFLGWREIEGIIADDYVVHVGRSTANPIIRVVHHKSELDGQLFGQDRKGEMVVLAYQLVSEPNTLLGLLNSLLANPDARSSLVGAEATELLRPPPLFMRLKGSDDQAVRHTDR